ncbi:hypothetical protein F5887DRAFT_1084018 [Amanita rubescens]|nr:hypothetical protein F5887DRAFT_1084018 [Amanita rubescens]
MAKFTTATLIVLVQLVLVITSVAGLPIETPSIKERDTIELESRYYFNPTRICFQDDKKDE